MTAGKRLLIAAAAAAAGLLVAAASAGAQASGTATASSGFSVENLIAELSCFLPEEYAGFGGRGFLVVGGPGGAAPAATPGGATGGAAAQGSGQQAAPGGQTGQVRQGGQRPQGFAIPQFKREAKLMLTAKQVDTLLPVLQDLQKTPFPTPSQAKKVTSTVDATLTKQQKDAYDKYVKERDKAMEELRKQFQSRVGTQGAQGTQGTAPQGGFVARGEGGSAQSGQGQQRQQMDPAELRRQMLEAFIKNLQEYRKTLK